MTLKIISRKEAIALGLKWYYTGKPCKRGHLAKRYTGRRDCSECKLEEARQRWLINSKIMLEKQRQRRAANREGTRETNRRWYAANREKKRESNRRWCAANPEKERERGRRYKAANPEKKKLLGRLTSKRAFAALKLLKSMGIPREILDDLIR